MAAHLQRMRYKQVSATTNFKENLPTPNEFPLYKLRNWAKGCKAGSKTQTQDEQTACHNLGAAQSFNTLLEEGNRGTQNPSNTENSRGYENCFTRSRGERCCACLVGCELMACESS